MPVNGNLHFIFDLVVHAGLATVMRVGTTDVFALTDAGREMIAWA